MMASMMSKLTPEELDKPVNSPVVSPLFPIQENIEIYNKNYVKIFCLQNEGDQVPRALLDRVNKENEVRMTRDNNDLVAFAYNLPGDEKIFVVSKSVFSSRELNSLKEILVITFFIILLLAALSSFFLVEVIISPVRSIATELEGISGNALDRRLAVSDARDDASKVRFYINKLLSRIEDSFNNQRSFLSNLAHEIRNPVAAIISEIEVSNIKPRNQEEYRQTLQKVLSEALEVSDKTTQLMELSKLSMAGEQISFSDVRIDDILWQAKAQVLGKSTEYRFKFNTEDFPDDSDFLIVRGNETLVRMTLYNLLENACKFSPDHTAMVRLYVENQEVKIEIRDKAPCIAPEEYPNLFRPFYRGSSSAKVHGTGIGLSLVGQIVHSHGFNIAISAWEQGNIFCLSCPVKRPHEGH